VKILHIIPNLKKGGAERLVIDIVRALLKLSSNKVKLILFEGKIEYPIEDIAPYIEVVPAKVSLSVWKRNTYEIDRLQNAIESFQPHIIHTHLFEAEIVSRSCNFPHAKWFTHVHDRMPSLKKLRITSLFSKRDLTNYFERKFLLHRYASNGGNQFVAISQDISSYLLQIVPPKKNKVILLKNAIDVKRFVSTAEKNTSDTSTIFKLISVGRLDQNKNHVLLIECVSILKTMGQLVHLTILGEGDQRTVLENRIQALHLDNEVSLPGTVGHVEHHLWESNLYLHAALTEGFGLTIVEAMAAGLPVVALDGGGNRDLVENGINGYLIAQPDAKLFAEKIINLLQNHQIRSDMGKYAAQFAVQFSIEPYGEKLIDIYKNAVACAE
jgi:glycosyltransferase involved in cell wall biosynthesis